MASGGDGESQVFDEFASQLQATGDFIKSVAEAKKLEAEARKADAEAALLLAQTERERIEARIRLETWLTVIRQLQTDLAIMNRESRRAARSIEILANRARRARDLLKGRPINTYPLARAGYKHYEKVALGQGDLSLFDLTASLSTLAADQFVDNNDPDRAIDFPPPSGDPINVLQLINWTFEKRYIARSGTAAQRLIVQLFGRINSVAENSIARIEAAAARIRDHTFELWRPATILGVELTPAQQRVLQATGDRSLNSVDPLSI